MKNLTKILHWDTATAFTVMCQSDLMGYYIFDTLTKKNKKKHNWNSVVGMSEYEKVPVCCTFISIQAKKH